MASTKEQWRHVCTANALSGTAKESILVNTDYNLFHSRRSGTLLYAILFRRRVSISIKEISVNNVNTQLYVYKVSARIYANIIEQHFCASSLKWSNSFVRYFVRKFWMRDVINRVLIFYNKLIFYSGCFTFFYLINVEEVHYTICATVPTFVNP